MPKQLPDRWRRPRRLHPGAALHGPALAAPAVGAGRDLQPLSEPDRAGPAPPLGGDPPADRQGAAHLGRDPLRPGRHPRARHGGGRPGPRDPGRPPPDRGPEAGAHPDLPVVPPRERGPARSDGRRGGADLRRPAARPAAVGAGPTPATARTRPGPRPGSSRRAGTEAPPARRAPPPAPAPGRGGERPR